MKYVSKMKNPLSEFNLNGFGDLVDDVADHERERFELAISVVVSCADNEQDVADAGAKEASNRDSGRGALSYCFLSQHPPTHATLPNGVCVLFLFAALVLSVVMTTEKVFFFVDSAELETITGTLWEATRTHILNAANSSTTSLEAGVLPACQHDHGFVAVVVLSRISSVAMASLSFSAATLVLMDGVWRSLPRCIVMAPIVALALAAILRWVSEFVIFSTSFCGQMSLSDQGFTDTASLTSKVAVVVLAALSGVLYFVLYPIHHLSRVLDIEPSRSEGSELRDPLLTAVGIAALFAVAA